MPVLVELFVVGRRSRPRRRKRPSCGASFRRRSRDTHNNPDPGGIQRQAGADLPTDKVYADWTVGTDPKIHLTAVKALFDSGATIVNIHSGQPDQRR